MDIGLKQGGAPKGTRSEAGSSSGNGRAVLHFFISAFLLAFWSPWPTAASSSPYRDILQEDNMEMGLTLGFYTHRVEGGVDVKQFSIRPYLGYFLSDVWVLRMGYDFEEVKRDLDVWRTHLMMLGPVVYLPVNDFMLGYVHGDVGGSQSVSRRLGTRSESQGLAYDAGMGMKFFLWNRAAMDLGIRWVRVNEAMDRDRLDFYVGASMVAR